MATVVKTIEVEVPVRAVYDQWTQFEEFPRFMEGVESVDQLDDTTLRWHVNIAGADRTFETRIEEQEPDRRIAWRTIEGQGHAGTVTFEPADDARTRVAVEMSYDDESWTDKVADFLNVVDRRVAGDLQRFKEFIEEREGAPTGAWRGEIHGGQKESGPPTGGVFAEGEIPPADAAAEPDLTSGTGTPGATEPPIRE